MRAYLLSPSALNLPVGQPAELPSPSLLTEAARFSSWYLDIEGLERIQYAQIFETNEPGLAGALALTQSIAKALVEAPVETLVLFEDGSVLQAREAFLEQAVDAAIDDPPIFLWVAFELIAHEDGTRSVYTHGAPSLGAPLEIEVGNSKRSAEELLERVSDAVLVALSVGQDVKDGDTIELSEDAVRVRIQPSLRNSGERTWRLRIP